MVTLQLVFFSVMTLYIICKFICSLLAAVSVTSHIVSTEWMLVSNKLEMLRTNCLLDFVHRPEI
jgi:hypothetical protein